MTEFLDDEETDIECRTLREIVYNADANMDNEYRL